MKNVCFKLSLYAFLFLFSVSILKSLTTPTLLQPVNNSTNVSVNLIIRWYGTTNATSYRIQVSTGNTFSSFVSNTVETTTAKALSGLNNNSTYYWRVCSKNSTDSSSWSSIWRFTTINAPLGIPSFISPTWGATNVSVNPTLVWSSVANAESYRVQISTSLTFNNFVSNTVETTTSKYISGLSGNTAYYWRVCSKSGNDSSGWPTILWYFNTISTNIGVPSLMNPSNGSTSVTINPNLIWSIVTNATSYRVQVSTSNIFMSLISNTIETTSSKSLTGLSNSTTYYWRVCSKNSTDSSSWSSIWSFSTIPASVQIGNQIWMIKNLDVDHYRNGDTIPQITNQILWSQSLSGAWCYYNNNPENGAVYGKLYNWFAINDPRGLAPAGWHVASDAEWSTLTDYLGGSSVAGGKLKETGTTHWNNNTGATNSSGFTALPGGHRLSDGSYYNMSVQGDWWTSTPFDSYNAYNRALISGNSAISRYNLYSSYGFSIRCVKDESPLPNSPVLVSPPNNSTNITIPSIIQWYSSSGATTYNLQISTSSSFGTLISNVTGITGNSYISTTVSFYQRYYWRVSASNTSGTSVWSTIWNYTTIPDTIHIGTQIWKTRNLDVDHYRNGDLIPQVTDPNQWSILTTGAWCYYNNDPANGAVYGKLYNWYAVNDSRGLTPTGWHVPNNIEWSTLIEYLGGVSVTGGKLKESGTAHWIYPNYGATNSSGFSALPGGSCDNNGGFYDINHFGFWWASSEYNSIKAFYYVMGYNSKTLEQIFHYKNGGLSVRCIKDESTLPTPPVLVSPANNSTNISLNPFISWYGITNAISYRIQLSTGVTFAELVSNTVVTTTSLSLSGLTHSTNYFWRVRAYNSKDTSDWSSVGKFTTGNANISTISSLTLQTIICQNKEDTIIKIYNTGQDTLLISSAKIAGTNASDFSITKPFTKMRINMNSSDSIGITFNPGSLGIKTAEIDLTSNSGFISDSTITKITLMGRKELVQFSVSKDTALFKNISSFTEARDSFVITNTGTIAITWSYPINLGYFIVDSIIPKITPQYNKTSKAYIRFTGDAPGVHRDTTLVLKDKCLNEHDIHLNAVVAPPSDTNLSVKLTANFSECSNANIIYFGITNPETAPEYGLQMKISNGSGHYLYSWSPPAGLNDPNIAHPTLSKLPDVSELSSTIYTLHITDLGTGDTASGSFIFNLPQSPTVTLVNPALISRITTSPALNLNNYIVSVNNISRGTNTQYPFPGYTLIWKGDNFHIVTPDSPLVSPGLGIKRYELTVHDNNSGCASQVIPLYIFTRTGVRSFREDDESIAIGPNSVFAIYPSMPNSILNVDAFSTASTNMQFLIINLLGQVIEKIDESSQKDVNVMIDVSGLSSGMYFLIFRTDDEILMRSFIKQ
jgi:uncharacterized protein (TIGR02145 family)